LEPARVAGAEEIVESLRRSGERLLDHEVRAAWRRQPRDLEVRGGRRADDDAGRAVQRRLEGRRDTRVRKLRSSRVTLCLGGVVRLQRLDTDRVEVAEMPPADRSESDHGDLHAGSTSSLSAARWSRFHSISYAVFCLKKKINVSW